MRTRFALGFGLVIAACLAFSSPPPAHAGPPAELLVQQDSSCVTEPTPDVVTIKAVTVAQLPIAPAVPASETLLLSLVGIVGMTAAAAGDEEKKATKREIDGAVTLNGRVYTKGQEEALMRVLPRKDIDRLVDKGVLKGDWARPAKEPETVARTAETTKAPAAETVKAKTAATEPAATKPAARKRSGAKKAAKKASTKKEG